MNPVTIIDMQAIEYDCAMCEVTVQSSCFGPGWAVPWYCAPVREGESDGGYQSVCESCHDRWVDWESGSKPGDQMVDFYMNTAEGG